MRKNSLSAIRAGLVASLVLIAVAAGPAGARSPSEWHRLNPNADPAAAEHERLTCLEGASAWTCGYDKLADPGFAWNDTVGHFSGPDTTGSWSCPAWFPAEACTGVVQVLSGNGKFLPDGGRPFTLRIQYIVTQTDDRQLLWVYWVDQFVCPWFRTFDEAVAANPDRTHQDCTFS